MMTATDMDRITGNIDYLFDYATTEGLHPAGSTVSQTRWTKNDIITKAFWEEMLGVLSNICAAAQYNPLTSPDNQMTWDNINNVETISMNLYYIIGNAGSMANINHWAGDDIYSGDPINAGGTYN